MKNLKKFLFALAILFVPVVANAASTLPAKDVDGKITLTEDVTLSSAFIVKSDEEITLDLGTFKLVNASNSDTIYVEKGGKLTIVGNGIVENTSAGYATVFNNGTTNIKGGTYLRDTASGNNWYVVVNHGNMTIENATVKVNGTGSSLIENGYVNFNSANERIGYVSTKNIEEPTLVITSGTFDGGMNTIKNDDNGILTIKGGTFQNNYQVSLMNWNKATIEGGVFKTPAGNDKTNIFVGTNGADSVDKGILVIKGGEFYAEHLLEGKTILVTPVEITGGTYNITSTLYNEDPTKTPESELDGSKVNINGSIKTSTSTILGYVDGGEVELTFEPTEGTEIPKGVTVILPSSVKDKFVEVENPDGTTTLMEAADITKLIAILDKIDALNEEDYTEESLKAFEEAALSIFEELNKLTGVKAEQAQIDEITKNLEKEVSKLVLKSSQDTTPEPIIPEDPKNEEVNPGTGDTIVASSILAVISILGLGISLKTRKSN